MLLGDAIHPHAYASRARYPLWPSMSSPSAPATTHGTARGATASARAVRSTKLRPLNMVAEHAAAVTESAVAAPATQTLHATLLHTVRSART